jgi:hypothetical protein
VLLLLMAKNAKSKSLGLDYTDRRSIHPCADPEPLVERPFRQSWKRPPKKLRVKLLLLEANIDWILPAGATPKEMTLDRKIAKEFGTSVPLLMGGRHDHKPFLETIHGCQILSRRE